VLLEHGAGTLHVWCPELGHGAGTTSVQVGEVQWRLSKGLCQAEVMSRIWMINQDFGWSIFIKHLFHQQMLCLKKWNGFANVCPFWWQIGETNLCLSCAHSYCLSCAMLKPCWNPRSAQFILPGFEPALWYSSGKFPNYLLAFFTW